MAVVALGGPAAEAASQEWGPRYRSRLRWGKDQVMDKIKIRGGRPLVGEIAISGSKNAALPLMAASLLSEETLTLSNLPHLHDISTLANLLAQHGVQLHMNGQVQNGDHLGQMLELTAGTITSTRAPYDLVRRMRASVLVLGPLVAREGHAEVSLPGGCAIGTRPVDIHLKGLELLGAEIELKEGYIHARAPKGLTGAEIVFPQVSVGSTLTSRRSTGVRCRFSIACIIADRQIAVLLLEYFV